MFGVYYVYWGVIPYGGALGVGEFYGMYEGILPTFLANIALSRSLPLLYAYSMHGPKTRYTP